MRSGPDTLREVLEAGPFRLAMSSGFFGFFAHCGMLSALEDEGLLPASLSGSSSGGLIAGMWASGIHTESIRDIILSLRRRDFWDPGLGLGLLRGRRFQALLRKLLPVATFEECRRPLALSAFDVLSRRIQLMNEGDLASAIVASCSVPGLFQPTWRNGRALLDGSLADRPGLAGAALGEPGTTVLYHHLQPSPYLPGGEGDLELPRGPGLITLELANLPQVHPFALSRGKAAFYEAAAATRRALDRPLAAGGYSTAHDPRATVWSAELAACG